MSQVSSTIAATGRPPIARPSLTSRYLLAFATIGVALSVAGPALSFLRDRAGTDDGGIATVFVGQSTGYVLAGMLAGKLLDRGYGHKTWLLAVSGMLGGLIVVAASHSLPWMVAGFAIVGAAAAVGDVSGNTLTLWNSTAAEAGRRINALHLSFAVGAIATPLVVSRSLAWTSSLWLVLAPILVIGALITPTLLAVPPPQHLARSASIVVEPRPRPRLARAAVCAFFFLYVAFEVGFAGWIHTYAERVEPGSPAIATGVNVTFLTGFAVGRLAAVWLAGKIRPVVLIGAATALSLVTSAAFVVWRGQGGPWLWVITFWFAVSVAPQYPSMFAFAEQHLALHGSDASWIVATSGVGGLLAPYVVGQLFDAHGPSALPWAMVTLAVATALSFLVVLERLNDRR